MAKRSTTPKSPALHPSVAPDLYRRRIKNGWSPDRAANQPDSRKKSPTIRISGVRTTIAKAMRQAGVSVSTYHSRLRIGWTKARAASTPPGRFRRPDSITELDYEHEGKRMSLWAWSKELGFVYGTVLQRFNQGLSFEEAIEHKFYGRLPKKRQ